MHYKIKGGWNMWAYESVFYQIYPLGFCGAPFENDGVLEHRITKIADWIPHIKNLGETSSHHVQVFFASPGSHHDGKQCHSIFSSHPQKAYYILPPGSCR